MAEMRRQHDAAPLPRADAGEPHVAPPDVVEELLEIRRLSFSETDDEFARAFRENAPQQPLPLRQQVGLVSLRGWRTGREQAP